MCLTYEKMTEFSHTCRKDRTAVESTLIKSFCEGFEEQCELIQANRAQLRGF